MTRSLRFLVLGLEHCGLAGVSTAEVVVQAGCDSFHGRRRRRFTVGVSEPDAGFASLGAAGRTGRLAGTCCGLGWSAATLTFTRARVRRAGETTR